MQKVTLLSVSNLGQSEFSTAAIEIGTITDPTTNASNFIIFQLPNFAWILSLKEEVIKILVACRFHFKV